MKQNTVVACRRRVAAVLAYGMLWWWLSVPAAALDPAGVLVIANGAVEDSVSIAKLYMQRRAVPSRNLLILQTVTTESCSRQRYEQEIAAPIRKYLANRKEDQPVIRCLVVMTGIPLKILGSASGGGRLRQLRKQVTELTSTMRDTEQDQEARQKLRQSLEKLRREISQLAMRTDRAAVDSELILVKQENHSLKGWLPNPFFVGFRNRAIRDVAKEKMLLVSRLDGPSGTIVRRIIDDSLAAESRGLQGRAFFDARWPLPANVPRKNGYALYDYSIHRAADAVRKRGLMPVVIDSGSPLFRKGECSDAALYCGWYSLGKYVDAFTWQQGAVGYHIASNECTTLHNRNSQVWCKMMLEKGVAATIGPVYEPYVQAFPLPEVFFTFLVDGHLTLAETYMVSLPYLSWQMVLVGDPLYRPFARFVKSR